MRGPDNLLGTIYNFFAAASTIENLNTELSLTGCFLFFAPFYINSGDTCVKKSAVSQILKPDCLAPTTMPQIF